jgi:molybdopterin-guanine dinucleotide biosynthesis protein A
VVVLAVDLPMVTAAFLRLLLGQADDRGIVPKLRDRFEPLAAVYPRACLPLASALLQSGERSLQALVRRAEAAELIRAFELRPEDEGQFLNLNTPIDLGRLTAA